MFFSNGPSVNRFRIAWKFNYIRNLRMAFKKSAGTNTIEWKKFWDPIRRLETQHGIDTVGSEIEKDTQALWDALPTEIQEVTDVQEYCNI